MHSSARGYTCGHCRADFFATRARASSSRTSKNLLFFFSSSADGFLLTYRVYLLTYDASVPRLAGFSLITSDHLLPPLRLSRAYRAGGDRDDHNAADAGGVAAGFDFGDAARMAAELVRSRPRRGPRRAASPWLRARARTRTRSHTHTRA